MKNKKIFRTLSLAVAVLCVLSLFAPIASARDSYYINTYVAYVTASTSGKVLITFEITAPRTMSEIGSTTIMVYENGSHVKTYSHSSTSGMMAYNKGIHGNYITHQGTVGKTYNATVIFRSGITGSGFDNRTYYTNTVTAKN